MPKKYDYIIAGAGLAGLSLAYRIRQNRDLDHLTILLIDKDLKNRNDRTWCFWSDGDDLFDPILYHSWSTIRYTDPGFNSSFPARPYIYKMIRGIDFYQHTLGYLQSLENTTFIKDTVLDYKADGSKVTIQGAEGQYEGDFLCISYIPGYNFDNARFVWQHFKGWVIQTDHSSFDPDEAVFMDFRLPQAGDTRFFYVLPFSQNQALVELAIFSDNIPEDSFYDPFLKTYIQSQLNIQQYEILEVETGAIPMTDHNFNSEAIHSRVINIGTYGGRVKGSSGYAFTRIQKESDALYRHVLAGTLEKYKRKRTRFDLYDRIFLNAILTGKTSGMEVFGRLFRQLEPGEIFRFLDEETNFFQELKVFSAPPTLPFLKAFFEEIRRKW